jgi:hypothetical protein
MPVNPWIAISSSLGPKIREIVKANPKTGFLVISTVYGIASAFFFANFYSLGLSLSFSAVFLPLLAIGPLLGFILILFDAWLLQKTGSLVGGNATFCHCRAALAYSKIPYFFTLSMWLIFMLQDPTAIFLHVASDASAICIAIVSVAVYLWSLLLLVQLVREVQSFSIVRALLNVVSANLLSFSIICFIMFISRFIYLIIVNLF